MPKPKFRLPKRTAVIEFDEGTEFAGAEVRCALDVPMRTVLSFRRMQSGEPDEIENAYKLFARSILLSWNIEDDAGAEVPCTEESFIDMPLPFLNAVTSKWIEAATGVPKASENASTNGSTSAEEPAKTEA